MVILEVQGERWRIGILKVTYLTLVEKELLLHLQELELVLNLGLGL